MSLLIVLGLVAFGLRANAKEVNPTCTPPETNPNKGDNTTLTCSFVGDIELVDIIVELFHHNSSRPEQVADCYPDNGGSHTCEFFKEGVNFTLIPGKEQSVGILQISRVTQESAGKYVCQTISKLGNQLCDPCVVQFAGIQDASLTVDENGAANNNKKIKDTSLTVNENGAANNNKNMAPEKPETDQTSPLSSGVIVGSLVGAVCLLGLLVAGGFIIRRTRHERNTSQKNPIYNPISTNPAVTV